MKAEDAKWRIETFKQGKKNTADFIIEFEVLAMKADTDELHTIFLLKKNVQYDIIKMILGYPLSQIRYSLVVILELNDISEVQYKGVIMIDDGKYQ